MNSLGKILEEKIDEIVALIEGQAKKEDVRAALFDLSESFDSALDSEELDRNIDLLVYKKICPKIPGWIRDFARESEAFHWYGMTLNVYEAKDLPEWAERLKENIEKDGHLETLIIYCNSPPEMDNSGYSDLKLIS